MDEEFHVFISYTQEDGDVAATVASSLRDLGLRPFLAEKEIAVGLKWEPSVKVAIRQSTVILCLVTHNSKRSAWLHVEAGAAWVLDKPIIPAFYKADETGLIDILRQHQGRKIDTPTELQPFLSEIRTLVTKRSGLPLIQPTIQSKPRDHFFESFTEKGTWMNLLKIGPWSRDEATGVFTGRGMHNYILSSNQYSPPFKVEAQLSFHELHGVSKLDAVNAGIVFGWSTPNDVRRYFNIGINE